MSQSIKLNINETENEVVIRITKKAESEPESKFADIKVGDYVEHLNGSQLRVVSVTAKGQYASFKCSNGNTYKILDGTCICDNDVITRILKASEVVLDFGKGIKGKVSKYGESSDMVWIGKHMIFMPDIAEPMRTTVLELLKAQSEES